MVFGRREILDRGLRGGSRNVGNVCIIFFLKNSVGTNTSGNLVFSVSTVLSEVSVRLCKKNILVL